MRVFQIQWVVLNSWLISTAAIGQQVESKTNIFGKQQKNQTEVFVAADVPEKVEKGVKETLAAAVKTWGSSGRLEYWVLGTDRDAAVKLASVFCQRRVKRGDMRKKDCLQDTTNRDHGFLT
ncbi:MAG: hypothetical protein VX438_02160, partial [Planctomycetota bacterium]|nr:hypothetical protein [Planctomycetota bacterium]